MIISNKEFYVEYSMMRMAYQIAAITKIDGKVYLAKPIEFAEKEDRVYDTKNDWMLFLKPEEAQNLMDELWSARIRPSAKIREPANEQARVEEIKWLRETADHLMGKHKK